MKAVISKPTLLKDIDFYVFKELQDSLCVSPGLIYLDYSVEVLAENIDYYYKTLNKTKKIILCDYYESPNSKFLILLDKIISLLCSKYGYTIEDFIFLTGCLPTKENENKIKNLFKIYNLPNIKIVIYPFFEAEWSCIINTTNCNLNVLHHNRLKSKNSLFFIGALRAHRIFLLYKLIELNLLNKTYFSLLCSEDTLKNCICFKPRHEHDLIISIANKIKTTILNTIKKYPVVLAEGTLEHSRQHELRDEDIKFFADSYFSIIGETSFFKNTDYDDKFKEWNFHLDYTFCTEKTFRAIACLHPFILVTRPYTLRALREMGYKTFSPYIDESYDEIENDDERLLKIIDTIEKMYRKTDSEWIDFQANIYPILLHNFNLLSSIYKSDKYINVDIYSNTRG